MKRLQLILFFIIGCIILSSCGEKATFEGKIARKIAEKDSYMILVIKDVSDDEINNASTDELMTLASEENNGMFFYIDKEEYNKVEIGQKVSITYSGPAQESLPPKVSADRIEMLNN